MLEDREVTSPLGSLKSDEFRSGFVSVIGRPNAGKSTLLNHLLGQKVLIMSDKPQTTRNRIQCILTEERGQIVFWIRLEYISQSISSENSWLVRLRNPCERLT